jgi:hypothetical protein
MSLRSTVQRLNWRSRLRDRGPDRTKDAHSVLANPADRPDPTEWPDPYDRRADPHDEPGTGGQPRHSAPGAVSTSEPHPREDPEAIGAEAPERDRIDE